MSRMADGLEKLDGAGPILSPSFIGCAANGPGGVAVPIFPDDGAGRSRMWFRFKLSHRGPGVVRTNAGWHNPALALGEIHAIMLRESESERAGETLRSGYKRQFRPCA